MARPTRGLIVLALVLVPAVGSAQPIFKFPSDPVTCNGASEGSQYANTTTHKIRYCDGTAWADVVTGAGGGAAEWGDIGGDIDLQLDLISRLDGKEDLGLFSGTGACSANSWVSTLNDHGAPTCTQPGFTNISGSVVDGQVPDTITIDLATLATTATTANAGDSATAFFPAGTVEVARGGTGSAPGAADQVLVSDSTSAATWRSVSYVLDRLGTTRGSILFRGASAWTILAPGTLGDVLTSNGAGADPTYQTPAGGGGGLSHAQIMTRASLGF